MFKRSAEPTFTHPVTACVPVDGGHQDQTFKAKFLVVPVDELGDTGSLAAQQDLLRRVVVGLEDIEGEGGQPEPFSDKLRDWMIRMPFTRAALFQTYLAAISKTRVGN